MGSVELLENEKAGKAVRKGQFGETPKAVGLVAKGGRGSVGTTDAEGETGHGTLFGQVEFLGEFEGGELLTAFVEDPKGKARREFSLQGGMVFGFDDF